MAGIGVSEGLSLVSGIAGMLGGGKRKTPSWYTDMLRAQDLAAQRISTFAEGYDPMKEIQADIDFAEKSSARTMEKGMADINRRFLAQGGNPSGDTAFTALKRRTTDDVLGPMAKYAAEARGQAMAKKLEMMMAAYGARQGVTNSAGQLAQMEMMDSSDGMGASIGMASQAIQGILDKQSKGRKIGGMRTNDPAAFSKAIRGYF